MADRFCAKGKGHGGTGGALNPQQIEALGFHFVLAPVGLGTALLIAGAVVYAHATGRRYPFRHFDDLRPQGTTDPAPAERLGLSEEALTRILQNDRQSLNLGVEDLARLIAAAEMEVAGTRAAPGVVEDIMSRDLVTVGPQGSLDAVAGIFRRHRFTALPVVEEGRYLGVIFQIHLIRRARDGAFRPAALGGAVARPVGRRGIPLRAKDVMDREVPTLPAGAPVARLLPMLAEGSCDAVPVLEGDRITGIVTGTDLIAALARQSLRAG